jgi:two-component system KDP operon response regulator KdpE
MSDPCTGRCKVLVVDDEAKIVRLIVANLASLGYDAHGCAHSDDAVAKVATLTPDLVILDLMMPGQDGFAVLGAVREFSDVPVIILTASDQHDDKLRGFELGADDYLTKPFALDELFARVKAVLRRAQRDPAAAARTEFSHGALRLSLVHNRAWVGEAELRLTATEFRLLALLVRRAGSVLTHEYLLDSVWGDSGRDDVAALRVALTRLRQKLRAAGIDPDCIRTYPGVGYLLERVAA